MEGETVIDVVFDTEGLLKSWKIRGLRY